MHKTLFFWGEVENFPMVQSFKTATLLSMKILPSGALAVVFLVATP